MSQTRQPFGILPFLHPSSKLPRKPRRFVVDHEAPYQASAVLTETSSSAGPGELARKLRQEPLKRTEMSMERLEDLLWKKNIPNCKVGFGFVATVRAALIGSGGN